MTAPGITVVGFDYSALPAEIEAQARAAADRIKQRMRSAFIDVGTDLISVKDRLPHGEFGKWLKAEFGMTERSAQNYMGAAALAAKSETVSVLRPKTLYALAAPSTPEATRQSLMQRFSAGEIVSDRDVRAEIAQGKLDQVQERRAADEAAKIAKLSPRARKSRAEREAEYERERLAREQRRKESEEAADAAELILAAVGEQAPELARLVAAIEYGHELVRALQPLLGLGDGR